MPIRPIPTEVSDTALSTALRPTNCARTAFWAGIIKELIAPERNE